MLPAGLQHPGSRHPIAYSKLLLVEGQDAFQFFKALLRHLNLLNEEEKFIPRFPTPQQLWNRLQGDFGVSEEVAETLLAPYDLTDGKLWKA